MQKFDELNIIYYNLAHSRKLLAEIDTTIDDIKEKYSEFYRNNIGEIDKTKANNIDSYILAQNSEPLGTRTIKLENNTYVMQQDLGDNEYSYLVFKKNSSVALPYKDEVAMNSLYNEYSKYTPLTKKQLLEKIYSKNSESLIKNKITKKSFFETDVLSLVTKLESLNIYDLTEALNFYRLSDGYKKQLKRANPKDVDSSKSQFYADYMNIIDRVGELNSSQILLYLTELKEKITSNNDENKEVLLREDKNEDFITKKEFEDLECISIPQSEFMLEAFYEKKLDMKAINMDIYKGKLNLEKNIKFTFQSPCRTLVELVDKLNSIDFYKSVAKNNDLRNYNKNDSIRLN